MNANWKQDPRLKNMNPQKLSMLTEFAKRVETTPKDQLFPTLLSLNAEASRKGIQFNDQETDLLISIMSTNMDQNEKKRIETLRMLSKNFMKRNTK
ncbi:hypothetical protein [Lacrimispora saccharolytica]|uniref:Uncharacterized protein n=1 Tax=Lacrimispora saccharolytica (strain ATCC 35040 / DSM 2544 / NRCC 2533 / WM1) TaxID=610130 RepID=D9RAK4_LACSW|nr:hypothetical protein [Lacrimispora saccharolytica]ADL04282.1 hypothetical protein Closa_1686 [[Clostridium] saccharolyticum WM1]QRV21442.1 hypothetical protein I6K70_08335 [Lacrimispora saccharolytica]